MRKPWRYAAWATVPLLAAAGAVGAVGSPAGAAPARAAALPAQCASVGTNMWNGCVRATAGLNARRHSGTGPVTFADPVIYTYPYGTLVHVFCYLTGPAVSGPAGTTTIWDAVDLFQPPGGDASTFGPGAYVVSSDAWIFTGSDAPVVPAC